MNELKPCDRELLKERLAAVSLERDRLICLVAMKQGQLKRRERLGKERLKQGGRE